jgi:hypothetical protein
MMFGFVYIKMTFFFFYRFFLGLNAKENFNISAKAPHLCSRSLHKMNLTRFPLSILHMLVNYWKYDQHFSFLRWFVTFQIPKA